MNIHVTTTVNEGRVEYFLQHDYDTDIFTGIPGSGPFESREQAQEAADRLSEALSCVSD